jgi:hypothetical protein
MRTCHAHPPPAPSAPHLSAPARLRRLRPGIALWIGGLALASAAWAQEPVTPSLPDLVTGDRQALGPEWRLSHAAKWYSRTPTTVFEAGEIDLQPGIRVDTRASQGQLIHQQRTPMSGQQLRWLWRLDQPLTGGTAAPDLTERSANDAALRVCLRFDHPLERVPLLDRAALHLSRAFGQAPAPSATVCYVWDSGRPATLQGTSPHSRRERFFSLQGKGAPTGQWVSESRDVARDFIILFADELPAGRDTPNSEVPPVTAVTIGGDADDTGSHSTAWIAHLRWSMPASSSQ